MVDHTDQAWGEIVSRDLNLAPQGVYQGYSAAT